MKLNKLITTLAVLAFASVATAGEDGFKISGDVAASVFSESGKGGNVAFPSAGAISATAGENNGDFSLDMAEINLEKSMGNSGVFLGIGYGRIFDHINYTVSPGAAGPKSTLNLTNAYFQHKLGDTGLTFKIGKFGSGVGYETYNYMSNMNYTRSYAFNYMNPWFFTGVAADYTFNDMISGGVVVANTTANADVDENESKVMGVNATIKAMEGLTVKLNYLSGREGGNGTANDNVDYYDTTRLNATVTYALNSTYDFAFHYSSLDKEAAADGSTLTDVGMTSMALYAGAKMETWGVGLRYEMVDDADLALSTQLTPGLVAVGTDNQMSTLTVTGWYNLDQNAVLKLEVASASADEKIFVDDNFVADDAMMTYGLGLMYRF